mmetsp:Transcript_14324/g.21698  ORF Transcript_14324/g.21698 Transcript_14324/m.21698 type:complete len:141 (+) Transcript_14324:152-574(+)
MVVAVLKKITGKGASNPTSLPPPTGDALPPPLTPQPPSSIPSNKGNTFDSSNVVNNSTSEDSYYGKFTEYLSDGYVYAKDSLVSVSDAASNSLPFFGGSNDVATTPASPADVNTDHSNLPVGNHLPKKNIWCQTLADAQE